MQVNCPHGWKSVGRLKNISIESRLVNICADICDSADLCGNRECEYYDTGREATRRFIQAANNEETIEGMMEAKEKKQAFKEKYGIKSH
jgi:hypothetical protein